MSNVTQTTVSINNTIKQLDQEALNNIANLSSINSETHKQLELNNINNFKRLLEDKVDCYYDNDNKYIDQKHDNLLVTNYDHQFLYPWVNLIIPNYTKPYCTNVKIKYKENTNESSNECNYTLKKNENSKQQMLYLTENQMFLIIISVLEQITNTPRDVPVIIDWVKVSRDSKLSQDVCKTFWWSFDKKHIKDRFGGCLFLQDWKHYLKVDESYFSELKNRVQYLIRLARECKEERERILYNNPNHCCIKYSDIVDSESTLTVDIIDKNTINHLLNVLKVHVGKLLRVGILNSTLDYGVVESITKWSIKLKLSENFKLYPPVIEKPVVDLVVGIPRPKSLDKLLQYSASIGVGNIDLICSSRVEKSYLASHKLSKESINKSLILGLQQGVCTLMPEVTMFISLGDYERACKQKDYAMKLIAHPDSEQTLGSLNLNTHVKGPILVAIGPEGGWLDHELAYYKKLGFVQFKLTDRILRTEVAAVAILSQMSLLLNDPTIRNGLEPAKR